VAQRWALGSRACVALVFAVLTGGCPGSPAPPHPTLDATVEQKQAKVSATEQGQTAAFLGPEQEWTACRVELWEVDGVGTPGAVDAIVSGAGRVDVQAVTWQQEDRYRFEIGARAVHDALRVLVEVDVLAARDEASDAASRPRIRIVLVNPKGEARTVDFASEPAPPAALRRSQATLHALVSPDARGARPVWSGGPTGRRPFP
jgi:hypothetical protein